MKEKRRKATTVMREVWEIVEAKECAEETGRERFGYTKCPILKNASR